MSRDYKNAGQGDKPSRGPKNTGSAVSIPGNVVGYAVAFLAGVLVTVILANGQAEGSEVKAKVVANGACEPEVITRYEMPNCPKPEVATECNDDPYKILAGKTVALQPTLEPEPIEPVVAPQPDLEPGVRYVIQVGSFRNPQDADAQRFELVTRHVFETFMQSVTTDEGVTWHRLNVGPFEDHDRLQEVRKILESMGITKYLMKKSRLPLVGSQPGGE